MQYCFLQHWSLLPSLVTSTAGCCFHFGSISSFFLQLFLYCSPVAYWAPTDLGSSSQCLFFFFCLFILLKDKWVFKQFLCLFPLLWGNVQAFFSSNLSCIYSVKGYLGLFQVSIECQDGDCKKGLIQQASNGHIQKAFLVKLPLCWHLWKDFEASHHFPN